MIFLKFKERPAIVLGKVKTFDMFTNEPKEIFSCKWIDTDEVFFIDNYASYVHFPSNVAYHLLDTCVEIPYEQLDAFTKKHFIEKLNGGYIFKELSK